MRRLIFFLIIFFHLLLNAATQINKTSLTLIPPSPVSDKITLSINGAVWNHADKEKEYRVAVYLDDELLHKETLKVAANSAKGIYFRWPTKNHAGTHQIIFVAESDGKKETRKKPLKIYPAKQRSLELIGGAWNGFYMWGQEGLLWNEELLKMTDIQWREHTRAMNEIGMNIIVLQESFRNQMYVGSHSIEEEGYKGKAFYPSKLYPGRMDIACKDPIEVILSEADKRNMSVFLPVGLYAWFDFTEGSLQWHKKVAKELYERYGHHPSFYGWYISEEIDGSLIANNTMKEVDLHHKEIVHFFKEFRKYVRTLAPDKPVMLASNSHHIERGLKVYPELLKNLDILCPFGFHRQPPGDLSGEEAANLLQKLCDEAGSHLWMDLETFLFGEHDELYPRPIKGLLSDLSRFKNFEKILCFQFTGLMNAHWMSRKPGGDATVKLYNDYKEYYDKMMAELNNSLLAGDKSIPPMRNPALPVKIRVKDVLSQMTLREKVDFVSGKGFTTKPNIRLGFPLIAMSDGPLGPNARGRATNYSSTLNMAATWDDSLMNVIAASMGAETRVMGRNMLLGPCINIARVPQGGRTFEGMGEDPFLVSRMAVAYVKGVQSKNVISCVKHFAVNNQEWNRGIVDVNLSERALREIYFPAFKAAVQEGGALSIMAAYNQFRGAYCCSNHYLLTDVLRKDWGFEGFVVSDWGGVHNTIQTALSGLDLEMPDGEFFSDSLLAAIHKGLVPEAQVDSMVSHILTVMFKDGLFDESIIDYGGLSDTPERRALALETARKSIILLKNENYILPLDKNKIKSLAVIGPNAAEARLYGGGSGYLKAHYSISPLQGLKNKLGESVKISYVNGGGLKRQTLPAVDSLLLIPAKGPKNAHGLYAEYFNNKELKGKPVYTRIDKQVDFSWGEESPVPGIVNDDQFSTRWSGKLIAPGSGIYEIGVLSDNGCRLYLDGKLIIDSWIVDKASSLRSVYVPLKKGRHYNIRVEFFENIGTCEAHLGLAYYGEGNEIEMAAKTAAKMDAAIICAGLRETLEGEGNDKSTLSLPESQIELINAVAKANPKTIVVLYNGTPLTMNEWLNNVPGLIEAFYPGQEGGNALADIIFGDVNPSGKLPLTFIKRWKDSPAYKTYPGEKERVFYKEGIYVGYRYLDKKKIEPLFPFGFGLSYTNFAYSGLQITPKKIPAGGIVDVKVTIKNSGDRAGDEIVQLYLQDVKASVDREVKSLKGFKRVHLEAGEKKTVTFKINKDDLAFYSEKKKKWIAEPGKFNVLIGSSSRDIRLTGGFTLQ